MKCKIICVYVLVLSMFNGLFLLAFRTPLFSSQRVLFYRGNMLLALVFILFLLSYPIWQKFLRVKFETYLAALVMSASIQLSFFVVFPVTFDRSVTMYLLNRLNVSQSRQCSGLSPKAMQEVFIKEYVKDGQAMRRRISEQSIINMVSEKNNCVSLTPRARSFLRFSELIKDLYSL